YIHYLQPLAPYLIFIMLLITFCKVKPNEFRVTGLSWSLLSVQILGSLIVYFALLPFDKDVAIGGFICVFCPTATAAPVITGMLGGSVPRLATYSIISNFTCALLAPLLFTLMGSHSEMGFAATTMGISYKVVPLILAPLLLALIMMKVTPRVHAEIGRRQSLSFYIWALSLFIVVGNSVSYIISHHENVKEMIIIAIVSLIVCCAQFLIGRILGRRFGDKIAGAQGLGQKNTVLAIWMALTFFHPITSIGPAAYVAWQNTINSMQLYFKAKKGEI
ncbi:MAG: transporter, partial [Muribaculaceae bacterium]|nr:transporter [Muribaculaceae bacterium]